MITAHFSSFGSLTHLQALINSICAKNQPNGLVIFGSIENDINDDDTDAFLKQLPLPIGGGLFPALFFESKVHSSGWIVYAVYGDFAVACIETMPDASGFSRELPNADTNMILVNGHARNISSLLRQVYADSRVSDRFFGGGVGSLSEPDKRCLISNQGLMSDIAVMISISARCGIGVSHGWAPASQIFRVTSAAGNIVHELDYRPALEVYSELVSSEFGVAIDPEDLIGTASMFPLGIRRIDGSLVVRDPIATTTTGGLICVGEFESDCFVYLLTSNMTTLLGSSLDASEQANADIDVAPGQKIVFDCISRYLLMGEDFARELAVLEQDGLPVSGVLSIGEIASNSSGFLEFYNKTTAVAAFPGA